MTVQTYRLNWQGIEIEARYEPRFSFGTVSHLVIESVNPPRARLPITETGFRSHFHAVGMIEEEYGGDVVSAVTAWLNSEAKSKTWQDYVKETCQFEMF